MYELLMSQGFDSGLLACLLIGASLIGLAAGGAPGVGSLAAPVIALGFTRFDKPQGIVTPLLILGQIRCFSRQQRGQIDLGMAFAALIPATLGLLGGILVWAWLISLPDSLAAQQIVKAGAGVIVLGISLDVLLARVLRIYQTPELNWSATLTIAFLGGILSTVANVAGPLFAWYFQSRGLDKHALTATVAFFFFVLNIIKLPFYWWLGLFHEPNILHSVLDWLVLMSLGTLAWTMWLVGAYWRSRVSERWFSLPIVAAGSSVGCLILLQALAT